MPKFRTRRKDYTSHDRQLAITKEAFDRFNLNLLGLGDVSQRSAGVEAICVIFDLAGFTNFCRQVDPHLAVPRFMNAFLTWLFERAKKETINKEESESVALHYPLPFLAKFMGDGVMFLWDSSRIPE